MSLHPPHLIDSSGSPTPAALIPFCAFQTDMTMIGRKLEGASNLTVCSHFKPTVLEGQLCYSLDVTTNRTKKGLKNGLVLILDHGISDNQQIFQKKNGKDVTSLNFEVVSKADSSARIHLDTLASFTDYRAGSYAMYVLKKMTGTKNFLNLPLDDRQCKIETFEACHVRQYIKQVQKECGCVPWALHFPLENDQVGIFKYDSINIRFFETPPPPPPPCPLCNEM